MICRKHWILQAHRKLEHTDSPRLGAEMILGHVLGLDRIRLLVDGQMEIPQVLLPQLEALVSRRAAHEPLAYLLGSREFYGRDFLVTPHTLIPRPDSELLVEKACTLLCNPKSARFIDIGTGTGCLAISLVAENPMWSGIALDISPQALECAKQNAQNLGVEQRLDFVLADMRCAPESLPKGCDRGSFDLIISNPPYIPRLQYENLHTSVLAFEPELALCPGPEGLELPRHVLRLAKELLRPGGLLLMEHGYDQGPNCRALCDTSWKDVSTACDLAGQDRALVAWLP